MNKNENGFEGQYVTSPNNQAGGWGPGPGAPMGGGLAREPSVDEGTRYVPPHLRGADGGNSREEEYKGRGGGMAGNAPMRKSQSFSAAPGNGNNGVYDGWNGGGPQSPQGGNFDNFGGNAGIGRGRAGFGPPSNQPAPVGGWGGAPQAGGFQARGGMPPRGRGGDGRGAGRIGYQGRQSFDQRSGAPDEPK